MSIATRKFVLFGASLAAVALALTGCAQAPSTSTGSSASTTAAKSGFLPCIVGDTGGFTDHSFNQLALLGVTEAASKVGSSYKKVQSATSDDFSSGISSLIGENCNVIVAPGFDLVAAVKSAAKANPKTDFVQIDDNSIKAANVKDVVYETDQAAFLGGYIAASYSKTGTIATWGGAEYPSVTIYMDGVYDGVQYYNQQNHKNVKVLGWNEATQKGTFVGNFTDQSTAKTDTQNFLNQGADVIIPVAGPLYEGAAAAIRGSGSKAVLEGVDSDIYETDPSDSSLFLVSILKRIDTTTKAAVENAASGKSFDNSTYIGTLANNGVGISSFHDYTSKVSPQLPAQLKKIEAGIEDGSIKVASPSSFVK